MHECPKCKYRHERYNDCPKCGLYLTRDQANNGTQMDLVLVGPEGVISSNTHQQQVHCEQCGKEAILVSTLNMTGTIKLCQQCYEDAGSSVR